MRASKGSLFCAITLTLFLADRAFAGQQSLLDPYADIQAPHAKSKAHKPAVVQTGEEEKEAAAKKKAASESLLSGFETEATQRETKAKTAKPEKVKADTVKPEGKFVEKPLVKEKRVAKEKPLAREKSVANKDSQDGVISGIKDIQSGYAKAFKAAGSNIVNGSKAAGGKVASGARSSGQFFLKGAQAIGHGFKVTGDKVKDSAGSVGSKMAVKPKKSADTPLKAKSKAVPENDLVANESEKVLDDSSAPGKPLAPLSTKPMVKAKTTTDGENKSLMGKTFGRLNPFARSKPQSPATTMQPSAQPQAVSDLRQAYPN